MFKNQQVLKTHVHAWYLSLLHHFRSRLLLPSFMIHQSCSFFSPVDITKAFEGVIGISSLRIRFMERILCLVPRSIITSTSCPWISFWVTGLTTELSEISICRGYVELSITSIEKVRKPDGGFAEVGSRWCYDALHCHLWLCVSTDKFRKFTFIIVIQEFWKLLFDYCLIYTF